MTARALTFAAFVDQYRLRTRRDSCGDLIALGGSGHLYKHDVGRAGLVLEDSSVGPSRARSLLARRRKALAAGFRLHQAGEAESILLFELGNPMLEKLAISLVGARRRRISSPAQLDTLRRAREAFGFAKTLAQRPIQGIGTHDFHGQGLFPLLPPPTNRADTQVEGGGVDGTEGKSLL